MRLRVTIGTILFAVLFTAWGTSPGLAAAEVSEDDLARAVKAVREELDAAMRAEDIDAYLALFMEDAVWMPPQAPAFSGKETARQKLGSFFRQVDIEGGSTVHEQVVMGPKWVSERGQFSILLSLQCVKKI